jgi:hypothetical protein
MQRRALLRRACLAGAVGLAGCGSGGTNADEATTTSPTTDASGPSPTATSAPAAPSVSEQTVETVQSDCLAEEEPGASVSIPGGNVVRFEGQLEAPTPCHEVAIASAEYDADADRLAVVLETASEADGCIQCIGILTFEGRVSIEGALPGAVTIRHGDTVLTQIDRQSGDGRAAEDAIERTDFAVLDQDPGAEAPAADVAFRSSAHRVAVRGTIAAADECKTAELAGLAYDREASTVTVRVATTPAPGTKGRACTERTVGIVYEATATFAAAVPARATIVHEGEQVVTAGNGGGRPADGTGESG